VQAPNTRFLPLLVSADDDSYGDDQLLDDLTEGISIVYSFGPPYGERLLTRADLVRLDVARRALRRTAEENLEAELDRVEVHGRLPVLMMSFDGIESSLLLAEEFWNYLEPSMPGELVVGVPARDVVIVTGAESEAGMEKVRRAIDRVFFAGDDHLLSRDPLVWRERTWEPYLQSPQRRPEPDLHDLGDFDLT
jgi:uncharacterized protein YtpQ (UPF0354 family)